jgi:hypothetical protein
MSLGNGLYYNLKHINKVPNITDIPLQRLAHHLGESFISLFIFEHIRLKLDENSESIVVSLEEIDRIPNLRHFLQEKLDDDSYKIIQNYIKLNLVREQFINDQEKITIANLAEKDLIKSYITLGEAIVNHLISHNILEVNQITVFKNRTTNVMKFKEEILEEDIFLQASYYKPILVTNIVMQKSWTTLSKGLTLKIMQNNRTIRNSENVTIQNNPNLKRNIDEYSKIQYSINTNQFELRKHLLNKAKNIISVNNSTSNLFLEIEILLGEFNCITKKIYEDIIIELYKIKHKRYPQMEDVYNILINKSIYDNF